MVPAATLIGLLATLASAGACRTPGPPAPFYQGVTLESRGDHRRALGAYRQAAARCRGRTGPCVLCRMRVAETLARLGRAREALAEYLAIRSWAEERAAASRAQERAAGLLERELGQTRRALHLSLETVLGFPDEAAAGEALARIVRLHTRKGQDRALVQLLVRLYDRVGQTEIGPGILFQAARIYEGHGQATEALALYDRLFEHHPRSFLADDSLWRAARLLKARRDWEGALRRLRRLLRTRKEAFFVGSYNSVYLDDAQLDLALLYLNELGDPQRALTELRALQDGFPDSVLRDDAQWWIAQIHLRAGRRSEACRALRELVRDFGDGNQVHRARRALAEQACP